MSLSNQHREELLNFLVDAFPTKSSLEMMLSYGLGKNLHVVAKGSNLPEVVFNLITVAESEGWIEKLINAACNQDPGKRQLRIFAQDILDSSEIRIKFLENQNHSEYKKFQQPDFDPSNLWSFHRCLLLIEKLLNERQYEEWIGDLEEFLYKMHKLKCPRWRFHIEILRRTFDLLKGVFIIKLSALPYKKKSSK